MADFSSSRRERSRQNQKRYRERQTEKIRKLQEQVILLGTQAVARETRERPSDRSFRSVPLSLLETSTRYDSGDERLYRAIGAQVRRMSESIDSEQESEGAGTSLEVLKDYPGGLASVSSRMNPGLTYGIIGGPSLDWSMSFNAPPSDIAQYLPHEANDFAKALFWTSMSYAYHTSLKAQSSIHNAKYIGGRPIVLAVPFLFDGPRAVLSRIDYRLLFFRGAKISEEHPGRDREAPFRLRSRIYKQMEQQGVARQDFLDALQVETLLKSFFGPLRWSQIAAWMSESSIDDGDYSTAKRAFEDIVASAVCFGDGPRWRQRTVLQTFRCLAQDRLTDQTPI